MLPYERRSSDRVGILAGVGLVFAAFIALAYWRLRVWEDPRIDVVAVDAPRRELRRVRLPRLSRIRRAGGRRQGAARRVQRDRTRTAPPRSPATSAWTQGEANKRVARLLCAGGTNVAVQQAEYRGLTTCGAAAAVAGGGKGCTWGCLGFGDCARVVHVRRDHDESLRAAGRGRRRCAPRAATVSTACPKDLFEIIPLDQKLLVQCRSHDRGRRRAGVVLRRLHGVRQMRRRRRAGPRHDRARRGCACTTS